MAQAPETTRKYAMTRVRAGMYVMPTNDRRALLYAWRVWEDGVVDEAGREVGWAWAYGRVDEDRDEVSVDRDCAGLLTGFSVEPDFAPSPGDALGSGARTRRVALEQAVDCYEAVVEGSGR